MTKFATLFKKYRLRAEFETISSFGDVLAEEGYFYEESIFSHWQKGTRIPINRQLTIAILEIFVKREAVKTINEANELMSSAGQGYLTKEERKKIGLFEHSLAPFQVPHEIEDFIGRDKVIKQIKKEIAKGKTIYISGQSGVGKTTLAIHIGHILQDDFPDGILWYRLDTAKIHDIFEAIAHLLNETLPKSTSVEITASFIRSILAKKKILLILDNVEKSSNIHLLLPQPASSTLIFLSKQRDMYLPGNIFMISLESFTENETLYLFKKILTLKDISKHKHIFLKMANLVGYLPLALQLFAQQMRTLHQSPEAFYAVVKNENLSLQNIQYENKNLYLAINVSYKLLSKDVQVVFLSLGVFEGKDFTPEAIAYMNGLSVAKAKNILEELYNASLIEFSVGNKFRIHPIIKKFITEKLNNRYFRRILQITIMLFCFFTIFWIFIQAFKPSLTFNDFFSNSYFVVPLWGSLWGFYIFKKWGGMKSVIGKMILFFSMGLFFQTLGQIIYALYIVVFNLEIPYPSLGDIFYFGCIFVYLYAVYLLAKVSEIKIGRLLFKNHIIASTFSLLFLIASFVLLLQQYVFVWSNPLKIFLDFAYQIGDGIYTFFALLLYLDLRQKKKNIMKNKVFLFFLALFMQYLSDFVFVYQANNGTWQVGNLNDYMYLSAYLLMSLAIFRFDFH